MSHWLNPFKAIGAMLISWMLPGTLHCLSQQGPC